MAKKSKTPSPQPSTPVNEEAPTDQPAWTATYDSLQSKLPAAIAARLPSSATAAGAVSIANERLTTLSTTSKQQWDTLSRASSQKAIEVSKASSSAWEDFSGKTSEQWKKRGPEAWCECAWSVTNLTQVPLNVSLNQVGPLYYEVLKPEETFERRVPKLPFSLEIRPYTSPSTAYTPWSTTWPILAVTGPAVAVASLIAIPFVAVAAGGTALASLTSFGSSVAAGATAGVAAAGDAAMGTAAAATAFVAKANSLPGAKHVTGKLADAAKKAVKDHNLPTNRKQAGQHVVRYLMSRRGAAAANGAGEGEGEMRLIGEGEDEERRKKARKNGKVDEVEVTGYDLEKVLKCETGNARVDKALAKAFKKISYKSKLKEFKTEENPVLRIVGGPELDTRTPPSSFLHPNPAPKSFLVFYPFAILHTPLSLVRAEAVPLSESPPTEEEERVMKDAKVVEKWETAEKAVKNAPNAAAAEEGEKGQKEVDRAVEQAEREEGEVPVKAAAEEVEGQAEGQKVEAKKEKEKKKGWFW